MSVEVEVVMITGYLNLNNLGLPHAAPSLLSVCQVTPFLKDLECHIFFGAYVLPDHGQNTRICNLDLKGRLSFKN